MSGLLDDVVASGKLPADPEELLAFLLDSNGCFISQEGQSWDFKEAWPFSYSDAYFGGICRLICGFSNAFGGLIVFGVHDETRKAGRNKVIPNVDRLQQAFRQLTGRSARLVLRRYDHPDVGAFDVLLVASISSTDLPLRFLSAVDKYPAGIIWVRQGHEVVAAEPRHIALLYCRSNVDTRDEAAPAEMGGAQLPPSPATIKRFVGRMKTVDRIFAWLKNSDEPRTFLYGKGGSGKSTIAYEVARTLKNEGAGFKLHGGHALEEIMYLSAKRKALNTETLQEQTFVGLDFTNEQELYEGILTLSNRVTSPLEKLSLDDAKQAILRYFDENAALIVIDDIDTLTTKGLEAGFDFLIGALWRSRKRSKVLYTLRNVPTQSLANSIEVPGLDSGGDYEEFVSLCADQFHVPEPDKTFVDGTLATLSERRPLVVESVIALRRHSGSYNGAAELFETRSGEDVRNYVFEREWNAIQGDSRGREILAILSEYRKPLSFNDLCALVQLDKSKVRDGLAAVQEMFLHVDHRGEETNYNLGDLTRAFVAAASKSLDFYMTIKTRVEKFKAAYYPENPQLSRLISQVEQRLNLADAHNDQEALGEAWTLVAHRQLDPSISEDPRYLALRGYVALAQRAPLLHDARESFGRAFSMRFAPDVRYVRRWFFMERSSDVGDVQTEHILNLVLTAKGYSEDTRAEFISRRAAFLYNLAREAIHVEPTRSLDRLKGALRLHVVAYRSNAGRASTALGRSEAYCRNTAYFLTQQLDQAERPEEMIDVIADLAAHEGVALDPLEEPLGLLSEVIQKRRNTKSEAYKAANKLLALIRIIDLPKIWFDQGCRARAVGICSAAAADLRKHADGKSR